MEVQETSEMENSTEIEELTTVDMPTADDSNTQMETSSSSAVDSKKPFQICLLLLSFLFKVYAQKDFLFV